MIHAENLSMWYGSTRALSDATFEVRQGEVLGLLGPNGAGKTTTLKILTTFMSPATGRVVVDGIDAAENPIAVRRKIGYLPEVTPLYVDMLVGEYLSFVGRARGLSDGGLLRRRDVVVGICGLEPVFNRPIGHLSKGFRQRVGLAQALIHDPEIVILDEPTSGLDPIQILDIRELIQQLAKSKTVIVSTHILQEIEAVSDRIMIINAGRIIAQGPPKELERRAMGADRLAVEVRGPEDDVERVLGAVAGVSAVEARPSEEDADAASFWVRHPFEEHGVRGRVDEALRGKGWELLHLARDRYTLEDVFVSLIREGRTAEGGEA